MKSKNKFIVEMDGRAVYASKNYDRVKEVAWHLIKKNPYVEIIVHFDGIIVGI